MAAFALRCALDRRTPLETTAGSVHDLDELIAALRQAIRREGAWSTAFNSLWCSGKLECWIEAAICEEWVQAFLAEAKAIRQRCRTDSLAIFALFYALRPQEPLRLSAVVEVTTPVALGAAPCRDAKADLEFQRLLFNGALAEWLRYAFPQCTADREFAEKCVETFRKNPAFGADAMRWRLAPHQPFAFRGEWVETPVRLAELIDRDAASRQAGIELLRDGSLRNWLVATGRLPDPTNLDGIVSAERIPWQMRLQQILSLLHPRLPGPRLAVEPVECPLGDLSDTRETRVSVRVRNAGRGYLRGSARVEGGCGMVTIVGSSAIEGEPQAIAVCIRPEPRQLWKSQRAALIVETNGGAITVPIVFRFAAPLLEMAGRSLGAGLLCALALGSIRFGVGKLTPSVESVWIGWTGWDAAYPGTIAAAKWMPFGLLFLATLGFFISAIVRLRGAAKCERVR